MSIVETTSDAGLRGNYYVGADYLSTDVRTGVTRNRAGTRMLVLTEDFLRGLRTALASECGSAADAVLTTCGRAWGRQFAQRLEKELGDFYGRPFAEMPLAMFEGCLTQAFSRHGWGHVALDWRLEDRGLFVVVLTGAVMAELVGTAERPVDALTAGVLAGLFSQLTGEDLACVQTACPACGAPAARFLLGLTPRLSPAFEWVAAGKSHEEVVAALLERRS